MNVPASNQHYIPKTMAHQNIQFIKILYAKINQGKNKTFMHNERFIHTILSKNPDCAAKKNKIMHFEQGKLCDKCRIMRKIMC